MKSWENNSNVLLCRGIKIIQMCAMLPDFLFKFFLFSFSGQGHITIFSLKNVLFSVIFDPQEG